MVNTPKKDKARQLRAKLLHSALTLFMHQGYQNTSIEEISRMSGQLDNNAFFRNFASKEAALLELMPLVLNSQMNLAEKMLGEKADDKILLYAFDIAVEYYVADESDALRDLYVAVYSLPTTADLIYKMMTPKLMDIFGEYFPEYEEKDFYEIDIATAGIIRSYMTVKCDMYFTLKYKMQKSLEAALRIMRVPEDKIKETINVVTSKDIRETVRKGISSTLLDIETNTFPNRQLG